MTNEQIKQALSANGMTPTKLANDIVLQLKLNDVLKTSEEYEILRGALHRYIKQFK